MNLARSASSSAPSVSSTWLATGAAYEVAKERGLQKSSRTFNRWLAEAIAVGKLSAELEELGLEANFKARRDANPKDNSVRWLRFC
jgi:predicted MarR family transcription regulator